MLQLFPKVVEVPKKTLIRATKNKLPLEQTFEQPIQELETIKEDNVPYHKDKVISKLQEELRKTHWLFLNYIMTTQN